MHEKPERNEYPLYSNEWLIDRYLQYGSVEDALYSGDTVPFSFAEYHRRLEKAGIVKSAGRQTNLLEALHFFHLKSMQPGMPLERLYTKMPDSFQTSIATLHRIYNRVKEQNLPRRAGTALVINDTQNPHSVLVGAERFGNGQYGKIAGKYTIPMTFSLPAESPLRAIVRVLQHEVMNEQAISGKFTDPDFVEQILSDVRPAFLTYKLLDIDIQVYALSLDPIRYHFSSHKLSNFHFTSVDDITSAQESEYRIGVKDMVSEYMTQLTEPAPHIERVSAFNLAVVEAS